MEILTQVPEIYWTTPSLISCYSDDYNYVPVPENYLADALKRINTHTNRYGELLVNMCISAGLRILNGRTFDDYDGKITCFQPDILKTTQLDVVDYVIASEKMSEILRFDVTPLYPLSDHCLL